MTYSGYLRLGGVEVLNVARTSAYVQQFLPRLNINVRCQTSDALRDALGEVPYTDPAADFAPWYDENHPILADFYGIFPGKVSGSMDGTRTITITEQAGDGATHSSPRYASGELRWTGLALASNDEALDAGMAWLRDVLGGDNCIDTLGLSCLGRTAEIFAAMMPGETPVTAQRLRREYLKVELVEGPKVIKEFPNRNASAVQVEFVLSTGKPWRFTPAEPQAVLDMANALNHTDPVDQDCYAADSAYDSFINDPYFTAISQPPAPPIMKPPNLPKITSWRRLTTPIPVTFSGRWGRVVPIVRIHTGATAVQQIRVRFYQTANGLADCNYEGEYLVSYLPPNVTMYLDARHHDISVVLPDGNEVPGSHLVYGSDGRPFTWPELGCHESYTAVVDLMPNQTGVTVDLDLSVRE